MNSVFDNTISQVLLSVCGVAVVASPAIEYVLIVPLVVSAGVTVLLYCASDVAVVLVRGYILKLVWL